MYWVAHQEPSHRIIPYINRLYHRLLYNKSNAQFDLSYKVTIVVNVDGVVSVDVNLYVVSDGGNIFVVVVVLYINGLRCSLWKTFSSNMSTSGASLCLI